MRTAVMLDIETLGTNPDCVILTVGMIKFDPTNPDKEPDNGLYFRLDVDAQLAMGRSVDESTLEWWNKQSADVRDEAMGDDNRVELSTFARELNKFVVGASELWAQGATFDYVVLADLYKQLGIPVPWHYYQLRDSRTLFKVLGEPRASDRAAQHNALADCYFQAKGVQECYAKIIKES